MSALPPVVSDPFAHLVLHKDRVDWANPGLNRHTLSSQFAGHVDYLHEHNWIRQSKNQFGDPGQKMTHIEIEREILCAIPPREWGGVSRFGKPIYEHLLVLIALMFPRSDLTDTLADTCMFFCTAVGCGKHILNLIGGQNMSKTAGSCRIAFATMFINPFYTKWTVANPFDNVADSGVWGEIEVLWDNLGDCWPGGAHTRLFPAAVVYSNRVIQFIPDLPRVARMELKNIKHTGKGKGAKSRKGDDNEDVGIFGELIDEINEIDNPAFLTRVVNSSSQGNYIAITSQNFKDPEDMGGQITEPVAPWEGYTGPTSFEQLNVDDDLWWHSTDAGITLRFDGHNSANILAGKVVYPYLFKEEDRRRIAASGTESPVYMSQVRSFPVQGATDNALLSKAKLSASRCQDGFYAMTAIHGVIGFCDPAFGGRDDAVYGWARFGRATVTDANGFTYAQDLLVIPDKFIVLKLVRAAVFNDFWSRRYQHLGLNIGDETDGAEISFEDQIAVQCLEYNRAHGIPPENFGYDFSMRADIVSSMNKIVGFGSQAFNYNMPPEGVPLVNFRGKSAKQDEDSVALCKNRSTELGMLAADMFLSKCLRGGENIPTAIVQTCRTHLPMVNRKYLIEDKVAYKAKWNNVSPDMRDVLFGLCGMAARRGFRANLKPANKKADDTGLFALLKRAVKFKSRTVAKLPY